jgi:hypothetical protein
VNPLKVSFGGLFGPNTLPILVCVIFVALVVISGTGAARRHHLRPGRHVKQINHPQPTPSAATSTATQSNVRKHRSPFDALQYRIFILGVVRSGALSQRIVQEYELGERTFQLKTSIEVQIVERLLDTRHKNRLSREKKEPTGRE